MRPQEQPAHGILLATIIAMSLSIGLPLDAASVIHRYDFENETGEDSVGGLDGELAGDPFFSDDAPSGNKSIIFEGAQYLRVEEIDFGSQFSFAMWVLPDTTFEGIQNLAANAPGGWDTDGFKIFYNTWSDPPTADGNFILETGDGADVGLEGAAASTGPGTVIDEDWYHLGVTVNLDDAEVSMYVDGELRNVGGGLNVDMKTDGPFEIGRMLNAWQMHGMMDDVQIYDGILTEEEMASLFDTPGSVIGELPGVTGDFDGDQLLTASDIDLLSAEARAGTNNAAFDVTGDSLVNEADRTEWVNTLKSTYFGDANLDLEFNSSDLVDVLSAGTYEADVDATWATGDFDGSGRTNSSDLVAALAGGGYETGPRAAVSAVPEPSSGLLIGAAIGMIAMRRRTARRRHSR
jgi:hypothetical protein